MRLGGLLELPIQVGHEVASVRGLARIIYDQIVAVVNEGEVQEIS